MLSLWSAVATEGPVGGFGPREFAEYFLASMVVRLLVNSGTAWRINNEIRDGTIAMRLLRPLHPWLWYAAETLAPLPVRLVVVAPVCVLMVWWGRIDLRGVDPAVGAMVPLAIAGAWLIQFGAMFAVGALSLFAESAIAVWDWWYGLTLVFSGAIVPVALLPRWTQSWIAASPFPYTLAFPVDLIVGRSGRVQALTTLGHQWTYAVSFVLLGLAIWHRGLARFAAHGG
jgi:ABC-2 type transport system permease protein